MYFLIVYFHSRAGLNPSMLFLSGSAMNLVTKERLLGQDLVYQKILLVF